MYIDYGHDDNDFNDFDHFRFHVLNLPSYLYSDYIDLYNKSYPIYGSLNPYSDLSQHGRDIPLINELRKHEYHTNNIESTNIFIIPNVLSLIHDADYDIKFEYDLKKKPYSFLWKDKYPNGRRSKHSKRYWQNVISFLDENTILNDHCFHNNTLYDIKLKSCHFYVPLSHSWTVVTIFNDDKSYLKYEFNVIANSIHPLSTPTSSKTYNHKINFFSSDTHIIGPYYHSMQMLSKYNLIFDNDIPIFSKRKYFASAVFSIESQIKSNNIRKKIFNHIDDYNNNNKYQECISYKINRTYVDFDKIFEIYKKSIFCAATIGDNPNSRRIYTEIISGCIPVLINCDKQWFAFDGTLLNWDYFSIVITEKQFNQKKFNWIQYIQNKYSLKQIKSMHDKLMKIRMRMIYLTNNNNDNNHFGKKYIDAIESIIIEMKLRSFGLKSLNRWIKLNG